MIHEIFDITKADIKKMSAVRLPELIGRLCEADLSREKITQTRASYGGNLSARDDGIDVFVQLEAEPPASLIVPNKTIVFQAKASKFGPSDISKEMENLLLKTRTFQNLAKDKGAYVIVSSREELTHRSRTNRLSRMETILQQHGLADSINCLFIDSQQLASWVRQHPSMMILVRNWVGKSLSGWKPYESWTEVNLPESKEFKIDEKPRFQFLNGAPTYPLEQLTTVETINKVRSILRVPGRALRLVGLSGVGKTRFAEALFDQQIGQEFLDPNKVLYAINYNDTIPSPLLMVENLIAKGYCGVVVVDNCSSVNHSKLTKLINNTSISLLTIEYDVTEDIPETTDVLVMDPSSEEQLVEILKVRFPNLPLESLQALANQTDGNPRLAIYISQRLTELGFIPHLSSEELYRALFWQGKAEDPELERTARAVSLLYSYKGELDANDNEIDVICDLSGQERQLVLENLILLEDRKLIQSRGYWRALLPHVLSNRLAKNRIRSFSIADILETFFEEKAVRAFVSFCHRLSYLHDSDDAKNIARALLGENGIFWVKGIGLRRDWWEAPKYLLVLNLEAGYIYTKKLLDEYLIDQESNGWTGTATWIENLARTLCYFPDYFTRALKILESLEESETKKHGDEGKHKEKGAGFFQPILSMTLASLSTKLEVIESRLRSIREFEVQLGLIYLKKSLTTHSFFASWIPHLGSTQLKYGEHPMSRDEWKLWYTTMFQAGINAYRDTGRIEINEVLADSFYDIWKTGLIDELISEWLLDQQDSSLQFYCWRVVINAIRISKLTGDTTKLEKLKSLDKALSPKTKIQKAKYILALDLRNAIAYFDDLLDRYDTNEASARYDAELHKLGLEFGERPELLGEIRDELFRNNGHISSTIKGLVLGSQNKSQLWNNLLDAFEKCERKDKDLKVFDSTIKEIVQHDNKLAESCILDLKGHEVLRVLYPLLVLPYLRLENDINCLIDWMNENGITLKVFSHMGSFRVGEDISKNLFIYLLNKLLEIPETILMVIDIVAYQIVNNKDESELYSKLLEIGQGIVHFCLINPGTNLYHEEYEFFIILRELTKTEYPGKGISDIIKVAVNYHNSVAYETSEKCFSEMADRYPIQLLQTTFDSVRTRDFHKDLELLNFPERIGAIINKIDIESKIDWCLDDSEKALFIARFNPMVAIDSEGSELAWNRFAKIFIPLLYKTPGLLDNISFRLYPRGWNGEREITLNKIIVLFDDPFLHENSLTKEWAIESKKYFEEELKYQIQIESEFRKNENTFE